MRDEDLLQKFEDCSLPLARFHHEEHVRVAYLYLRRYPLLDVLARFPANLRKFAAANGKTGLYHQTVSWAYLFLIQERLITGSAATWAGFKQNNPDLLDRKNPILAKYYATETLDSAAARENFVMPDRLTQDESRVHPAFISDRA